MYLHSVRIPLALTLGKIPIISGERQRHDGAVKVNQTSEALDIYKNLSEDFGVRLLFLGFPWREGEEQLGCVLSGNYRLLGEAGDIPAGQAQRYLKEFAMPCTSKVIEAYARGCIPNHIEIAAQILGDLS